jgi:hypothetical protein
MKLSIITDHVGNIVGTARTGTVNGITYGVSVPMDRFIHVIDVPDTLVQKGTLLECRMNWSHSSCIVEVPSDNRSVWLINPPHQSPMARLAARLAAARSASLTSGAK